MFRLSSDTALIELNTWRKVIQLQPVLKFLTIAWVYLIQVNLLRLRLEAFVSTNICVSRITADLNFDLCWSSLIGRKYQH